MDEADQAPVQTSALDTTILTAAAVVKIQRKVRQKSFTSDDNDEKARKQWVKFHLENGRYEEALGLGWDGDIDKIAQKSAPAGAQGAQGAASDAAGGTSGWSKEQAAASSKIAAVRKGRSARKERDDQRKGVVAIQSRFRGRHSRIKSQEKRDGGGEEAREDPGDTHSEFSGDGTEPGSEFGSECGEDNARGDDGDEGAGGEGGAEGQGAEAGEDPGSEFGGSEFSGEVTDPADSEFSGDGTDPGSEFGGSECGDDSARDDDGDDGDDGAEVRGAVGRERDAVAGDKAGGEGGVVQLTAGERRRAAASKIAAHRKGAKKRQQHGRERDAASVIAAHRKGARRRQKLLQEAEEASVRASRLSALVGGRTVSGARMSKEPASAIGVDSGVGEGGGEPPIQTPAAQPPAPSEDSSPAADNGSAPAEGDASSSSLDQVLDTHSQVREWAGAPASHSLQQPTSPSTPTAVREAMAAMSLEKVPRPNSPKRYRRGEGDFECPPGAPPSEQPPPNLTPASLTLAVAAHASAAPPGAPQPTDPDTAAVSDESLRQYWSFLQHKKGGGASLPPGLPGDELSSAELSLLRSEITRLKTQNKLLLQRAKKSPPPLSKSSDSFLLEPVPESSHERAGATVLNCCGATSLCSSTSLAAQPSTRAAAYPVVAAPSAAPTCTGGGDTLRRFESTLLTIGHSTSQNLQSAPAAQSGEQAAATPRPRRRNSGEFSTILQNSYGGNLQNSPERLRRQNSPEFHRRQSAPAAQSGEQAAAVPWGRLEVCRAEDEGLTL